MIVGTITTDGRNDLLVQALDSAAEHLPQITTWILVDDSGTGAARDIYDRVEYVVSHARRRGLAASVSDAWRVAAEYDADYLFHLEDDFTFNESPDLDAMLGALDDDDDLAQIVLKRQPVNPEEETAGGFIQLNPDAYIERRIAPDVVLTEHRECYSLNPHVAPRWIIELGWPGGNEAGQTARLVSDPAVRFAVWGAINDPPTVHHHGTFRTPGWSL